MRALWVPGGSPVASPIMGRVEGKVALISGGARGMGAADARMLVGEGANVVIGDILDSVAAPRS